MNAPSNIRVSVEFPCDADGMDNAVAVLNYAKTLKPGQAPPPPKAGKAATPAAAPPKGKPAPAPAPKAASKANSKSKPQEPEQTDIMDLNMGPDEDEDDDQTGGLGLADDEDTEENGFDGTAEEAKEEALAKLRTMLGNGLKSHVKEVQQIMKVAKFHDVPAEQGFEFLAAVNKVEAKIAKN